MTEKESDHECCLRCSVSLAVRVASSIDCGTNDDADVASRVGHMKRLATGPGYFETYCPLAVRCGELGFRIAKRVA